MKRILLIAAATLVVFSSCEKVVGDGPVVTETRAVSNFKSISVTIGGKVNYIIDPVYKIEIQAQQNILDVLQTDVINNELVVKYRDGVRVKSHEEVTVNVHAPTAESVNLSSSGNFILTGPLAVTELQLRVSGSGSITVEDAAVQNRLTATISGSGNINVQDGNADNETLKISGSGKLDLGNVVAKQAMADISGSGDMRVNLSQRLDAYISGSGSVFYRGTPVVSSHISGSGTVKPL